MKKAVFWVILLLVARTVFGQEFTFRGLPWGSSVNDVIAKEGNPAYSYTHDDGELVLTYKNVKIAGTTADLTFIFSKNRLIGAKYDIWYPDVRNPQKLYQAINLTLKSLYGHPFSESYTPKGTLYFGFKEDVDIWYYSWIFQRTHITFFYQIGDDEFSSGSIKYESPEMNSFGGL